MLPLVKVETMRVSDAYTIANFVSSQALMYRAAWGVYKAYSWPGTTAILAGSGNNGGDGFALACILQKKGHSCRVFTLSERLSSDSTYYARQAKAAGVHVLPYESGCLAGFDTVVDCLLGTGFQGKLRDNYRCAIEDINASGSFTVSVDINSGMNGDSGFAELAVRSDLTVTVGYVKCGMVTENAGNYMKRLVCADIGIVLLREDGWICSHDEPLVPGAVCCPGWLDMRIISALNPVE